MVPLVAAVLPAGCATTKLVDWNSRIVAYTFDPAITELGPPDKQARLSDGKTVAEWVTGRGGGNSVSVGMGAARGNAGFDASRSVGRNYSDRARMLRFNPNNLFAAWSKNH